MTDSITDPQDRGTVELIRRGESLIDAAHRNAIDAGYHERDHGGTMHTAGQASANVVLAVVIQALMDGGHRDAAEFIAGSSA